MTPQPPKKKRRPLFYVLLGMGALVGVFFLCVIFGLVVGSDDEEAPPADGTPAAVAQAEDPTATRTVKPSRTPRPSNTPRPSKTPRPSATPVPTNTPRPTRTPSPTPDRVADAREVYQQVLVLFAPGDAATELVRAELESIAAGDSNDTVTLYLLASDAADTWGTIKVNVYHIRPKAQELRDAIDSFSLCATYREEAYQALMSFLDTGKTSDRATFQEKAEDADALLMGGLVAIMSYAPEVVTEADATPTPGA